MTSYLTTYCYDLINKEYEQNLGDSNESTKAFFDEFCLTNSDTEHPDWDNDFIIGWIESTFNNSFRVFDKLPDDFQRCIYNDIDVTYLRNYIVHLHKNWLEKIHAKSQWKAYMGAHTDWSLDEAYSIYTRPGCGGKKWSKEESYVFDMISKVSERGDNPFVFRLMPTKIESAAAPNIG